MRFKQTPKTARGTPNNVTYCCKYW